MSFSIFIFFQFTVSNKVDTKVPVDFYLRLRGVLKDSPLIVFRDFDGVLEEDNRLNLG